MECVTRLIWQCLKWLLHGRVQVRNPKLQATQDLQGGNGDCMYAAVEILITTDEALVGVYSKRPHLLSPDHGNSQST